MCSCVELMPEVSEADCTAYDGENFTTCTNNDLLTRYYEEYPAGNVTNLVGTCDNKDDV